MTMAVDLEQGLEDAWSDIATFVPKLVVFLLILVIGYFVAKLIRKIVDAALERVGFDRAVERGGVGRVLASSRYDASDLVAALAFWVIMLLVLRSPSACGVTTRSATGSPRSSPTSRVCKGAKVRGTVGSMSRGPHACQRHRERAAVAAGMEEPGG
jgi:Mechanosensitive ion channel, conserved TM helix